MSAIEDVMLLLPSLERCYDKSFSINSRQGSEGVFRAGGGKEAEMETKTKEKKGKQHRK